MKCILSECSFVYLEGPDRKKCDKVELEFKILFLGYFLGNLGNCDSLHKLDISFFICTKFCTTRSPWNLDRLKYWEKETVKSIKYRSGITLIGFTKICYWYSAINKNSKK